MPRLAELRIRGLRTLADVTVSFGGLTVLIGDNGSGKSTILEAMRIARLLTVNDFLSVAHQEHVLASALRNDADGLRLDVRVEADGRNLVYSLSVDGVRSVIRDEAIHELPVGMQLEDAAKRSDLRVVIARVGESLHYVDGTDRPSHVGARSSLFEYVGRDNAIIEVVRSALAGIDSHLPFDVGASWANRSTGRSSAVRDVRVVEPARRLELLGANLANVFHTLKNSGTDRWRETLELLQLGLGPQVRDVLLTAATGGYVGLALELRELGLIPASQLADGQLTYMAFVGLVQLDPGRTLLTFDEPEQHLHPALLGRVVQLFDMASAHYPVVLATHSDRLLDILPDPCASVRVCELDNHYRTRLLELDRVQLDKWLARYSGLGDIRAAGQLHSVTASEGTAA